MSGRNKKLHVTYRCSTRNRKLACPNKEIRREYIEAFVLEKLSEFIFDDTNVSSIHSAYKAFLKESLDKIKIRDEYQLKISDLSEQINNLIMPQQWLEEKNL
jgi:site-specific DNA recombinase